MSDRFVLVSSGVPVRLVEFIEKLLFAEKCVLRTLTDWHYFSFPIHVKDGFKSREDFLNRVRFLRETAHCWNRMASVPYWYFV